MEVEKLKISKAYKLKRGYTIPSFFLHPNKKLKQLQLAIMFHNNWVVLNPHLVAHLLDLLVI